MRVTALPFVQLAQLEPVLAEELSCWKRQLYWDYQPAADLIRRHIALRALPGFALLDSAGLPVGYAYSLVERPIGYVGNVFIRRSRASLASYRQLIEALLDDLLRNPEVRRIEGQIFPFNLEFGTIFQSEGLGLVRRQYLVRAFDQPLSATQRLPAGYRFEAWHPSFLGEAGQVIFQSYQGSSDLSLCADYQTAGGCRKFVSNLLSGPGCGKFSPQHSLLIQDCSSRAVVAVLLASVISPGTLMIPQISVLPAHQGRGLGTTLLTSLLERNRALLRRAALSVSTANQRALRLYRSLGFEVAKDFFGLILERPIDGRAI